MAAKAGPDAGEQYGFAPGQEVQEFGYGQDVDESVRQEISTVTGTELLDEEHGDVVDGALIWWRDGDADVTDLTDLIVDAQSNLDDGGTIIIMTPKTGRPGHVAPADVSEAAQTAGLQTTSTVALGGDWTGVRVLVRPR